MKKSLNIVVVFALVAIFVTMAFVAQPQKTCPAGGCHPSASVHCEGNSCTGNHATASNLKVCPEGGCHPSTLKPCIGNTCNFVCPTTGGNVTCGDNWVSSSWIQ